MVTRNFSPHPIVAKLGDVDAVKLLGYFGSTTGGIVKVYPSLDDLSVHYEIREATSCTSKKPPPTSFPMAVR